MNEKLKKMLDQINAKKQEVKNLVADNKLEDATKAKEELKDLQAKFDLIYDLEEEEQEEMQNKAEEGTAKKVVDAVKNTGISLVNVIKAQLKKEAVATKDLEVLNVMRQGTGEDGGLTVPQDISTQIKELRRTQDALENLVNVETVSTESGSRVIEKYADHVPFDNVDEEAEFPEVSTPQFDKISYKIKKKGGILKVTYELLQDTAENILGYLRRWIAKKAKATRNYMILAKINEITTGKEVAVTDIDGLKSIFNISLDPAIATTSGAVTNQSGFNWLDTQKDLDGRYILQPDPTNTTKKLLFGKYPVTVINNKDLPNDDGGYPIICGDLKEAITLFDRETLTIVTSTEAGELWKHDYLGIKVRERLDIQTVDPEAIIKAVVLGE